MGRIAEYRRSEFASKVRTENIATAGRVGKAFAGAALQVGAAVDRSRAQAEKERQAEQKKKRVLDQQEANLQALKMETASKEVFENHKKNNEEFPNQTWGGLKQDMDKANQEIIDGTKSEFAKKQLSQAQLMMTENFKQTNNKWEREQTINNVGAGTKQGLESIQTESLRAASPQLVSLLEKKGEAFLSNLGEVANSEITDKARIDFKKNISLNSFKGMIEAGNIDGAEELLNTKTYDENLQDDGVEHIQKLIASKRRQGKAKTNNLKELKFKDAWKFLEKTGETALDVPLDLEDPESFNKRAEFIDFQKEKHKMEIPLMPKHEELKFIQQMTVGDVTTNLDKIEDFAVAMKPEQYDGFTDQIFKKNKELGIAMSVVQDDRGSAESIIRGNKLLKSKSMSLGSRENQSTTKTYYNEKVGNALPDQELRDDTYSAVRAMAIDNAHARGEEFIEQEDVDGAMSQLFGEVQQVNDFDTFSFKIKGEFIEDLDEVFENLEQDQILTLHGELPKYSNGTVVEHDDLVNGGSWLSKTGFHLEVAGDGEYKILDTQGRFLINNKGTPFILKMKGMMESKVKKPTRKPAVIDRNGVLR